MTIRYPCRPVLVTSHDEDPPERVRFGEGQVLIVPGHGAALECAEGNVYMAIALRNGGSGLAVIHGWRVHVGERTGSEMPALDDFRRMANALFESGIALL